MQNAAIFWPMMVQVAVTIIIYIFIFRVRLALVKAGETKISNFRTYEDEHLESRKWARALANQYELPVLFYAVCLASYVTAQVDTVTLVLAWGFAIVKALHVYIHVSSNRIRWRQPTFSVAFLMMILLSLWFAYSLATAS